MSLPTGICRRNTQYWTRKAWGTYQKQNERQYSMMSLHEFRAPAGTVL